MARGRYLRSGLAVSIMLVAVGLAGNAAALATADDPWAPAIQQVDSALARGSTARRAAGRQRRSTPRARDHALTG
jgi:hypothetical protein